MRMGFGNRKGFARALGISGGAVLMALASQAAADSCSHRADLCDASCSRRTGDDATRCFSYCVNERRLCLKTGSFRTTDGGDYADLDKR